MQCREATELLSPYLDGELEPSVRLDLERHLRVCDKCSAESRELRLVSDQVRSFPIPEPSPAFAARVLAGLPDGPPEGVAVAVSRPLAWLGAFSAGTVVLAVLLVLSTKVVLPNLWWIGADLARALYGLLSIAASQVQVGRGLTLALMVFLVAGCGWAVRRIASAPWQEGAV